AALPIADDQPTLDVLNEIGLDARACGHHESDKGQEDVNDRVLDAAHFPYLAANIVDASGAPVYDPYTVVETGGVSVGFIGAITEEMPSLVSPAGIEGLEFTDIGAAVNSYAAQLSAGAQATGAAAVVVA